MTCALSQNTWYSSDRRTEGKRETRERHTPHNAPLAREGMDLDGGREREMNTSVLGVGRGISDMPSTHPPILSHLAIGYVVIVRLCKVGCWEEGRSKQG